MGTLVAAVQRRSITRHGGEHLAGTDERRTVRLKQTTQPATCFVLQLKGQSMYNGDRATRDINAL
jgi:hypothetical protein